MTFLPTTTVTVLRDQGTGEPVPDEWGYPADTAVTDPPSTVATGLPARIKKYAQRTYDPESRQVTVVDAWLVKLLPGAFAFLETDRVKDESTGRILQVNQVFEQLLTGAHIRLECTEVR